MKRLRLGLLQCDTVRPALSARHGDYPALYARLLGDEVDWTVFHVVNGPVPDEPALCDGWLVSGSRHGAYEGHDWIPPLEALIRRIHGTRPLVGICFGHQIIAQALGGRVEKFAGGWSVGRRSYGGSFGTVCLNAWHQDQVTVPPKGAETILSNEFTAHAGLQLGPSTLTLQPHPEFSPGFIADIITEVGVGRIPEALLDMARAQLTSPVDNAAVGNRLAAFFREHTPCTTG